MPYPDGIDDGFDDDADLQIEARGYWEAVWLRLKRDKLALAGGVFIVLLFRRRIRGRPARVALPRPRAERAVPRLGWARLRPAAGRAVDARR